MRQVETVTTTRKDVKAVTCDVCKNEIEDHPLTNDENYVPLYDITLEFRAVTNYVGESHSDTQRVDFCRACFKTHILPALTKLGVPITDGGE